jgi:hypothetical protein
VTVPVPAVLGVLGLACLLAGALLLRRLPGYRIARLLRAAPEVSVAEAVAAAAEGEPRYLRIRGRITSDEEFPDEHDRPLVYRRRRLEVARLRGRWASVDDGREAVPFAVEERSAFIAVDAEALGEGLVVLPRIASGTAAEVMDRLPAEVDPESEVRFRVDQISAVEVATVAGVPRREGSRVVIGSGLGRPLILTTLEVPAAMRVLGGGRSVPLVAAAGLIAAGGLFITLGALSAIFGVAIG